MNINRFRLYILVEVEAEEEEELSQDSALFELSMSDLIDAEITHSELVHYVKKIKAWQL